MKWMIASDLHGSAYYCRKMLEAFEREGADRLFLLGDLLYHGPRNDLPREYAPKEVIPLLNGATVMPRWTRWCWNSPCWPIMRCFRWGGGSFMRPTGIFIM